MTAYSTQPQIQWASLNWRKYHPVTGKPLPSTLPPTWAEWAELSPHCYSYYCQRRKLRLYCMFRCCKKDNCKSSTRLFKFSKWINIFGIVLNGAGLVLTHSIINGAYIFISTVTTVFLMYGFFKDTNKMLKAIDDKPVIMGDTNYEELK